MPCQYRSVCVCNRISDRAAKYGRRKRNVTAGQTLGHRNDVCRHAIVLERAPRAAAPRTTHDFIGDQQYFVAVAHLTHGLRVSGRSGHDPTSGANDRLEHERRHVLRPQRKDALLKFPGQCGREFRGCHARRRPIHICGGHKRHVQQAARKRLAPFGKPGQGQSSERAAVVGAIAGNEAALVRTPECRPILQCDLHRAFDRLRAAGRKDDLAKHRTAIAQDQFR